MHRLLIVALAALALAVPALAAGLDPSALVLRQRDVPAGFRLDRSETGVRTNATEARNDPRLPALFERWERVTGYQVEFDRRLQTIGSRVDVFRSARGARELLAWYDLEVRKARITAIRRSRVAIGDGGWLYRGALPGPFVLVAWRQGRVFAGVVGEGISRERTLSLARVQERRIAAALR